MNDPLITTKWIALIASVFILVVKYFWAMHVAQRRDLIISIRLFSFYPSRRIEGTSSFGKKQFMNVSNWWSIAFWIAFSLCAIFWLLELISSK